MKKWSNKAIDLILYSNFYIACCAVTFIFQTQLLLTGRFTLSPVVQLVFCATLVIYALHRLVGLFKVKDFIGEGRYFVINKFQSHIWIYAVIGVLYGAYCFFQVNNTIKLLLVLPAFFSLGYVLPIFGKQKNLRLRDFGGLKIFLVAFVWAYVTVLLPALEIGIWNTSIGWMFLERAFFVFAITLPFDIRDLKVDGHNDVQTIPAKIGIRTTVQLAHGLLVLVLAISFLLYAFPVFIAMCVSTLSTAVFIRLSPSQQHDYFFSALLDGTILIQFLLVWISTL